MIVSSESEDSRISPTSSTCGPVRLLCCRTSSVPMIPFMGVRISWLIAATKCDFAALADSAALSRSSFSAREMATSRKTSISSAERDLRDSSAIKVLASAKRCSASSGRARVTRASRRSNGLVTRIRASADRIIPDTMDCTIRRASARMRSCASVSSTMNNASGLREPATMAAGSPWTRS